ncbi:hypothetical protein [Aeromonas phage 3]|nr:hypothetical protein [Aeromonas phage 3]
MKTLHPAQMTRKALEDELLAMRVIAQAYSDGLAAGEVQITKDGKARLMAAASTVRTIYGAA